MSTQPRTLAITGATGSQQSAILEHLHAHSTYPLRAQALSTHRDLPGVEWFTGDLQDPALLDALFTGAQAAAVHLPVAAGAFDFEPLVEAIARAQLARVIFNASSALTPDGVPPSPARRFADALHARGVDVVVLQPTLYLENLLLPNVLEGLRRGVLRYPLPADRHPVAWFATGDLGPLAAQALAGPAGAFHAAGPAHLDGDGLAAALAEGLGRPVRFEAISPETFGAELAPILGPEAAASVQGLYAGIAAAPEQFAGWLAPDASTTRATFDWAPTSAARWAGTVLRAALGFDR